MISYEVSIGLVIICVLLATGSLNLKEIVLAQQKMHWYIKLLLLPMMAVFFISILAETNRLPFDLPESEAEKFKVVLEIPRLFDQKIRTVIKDPKYANEDPCSSKMQSYLKSYLTNQNAKETGAIMVAMKEVLEENAIAQTDGPASPDVVSHQFFHQVIDDLIHKTAVVVMAEKTL